MICLIMQPSDLTRELEDHLRRAGVAFETFAADDARCLSAFYNEALAGVVVDGNARCMPHEAWYDLLSAVGRRVPVVILESTLDSYSKSVVKESHGQPKDHALKLVSLREIALFRTDTYTRLRNPRLRDIITALEACGAIAGIHANVNRSILVYNHHIPARIIREYGWLSVIVLDASSLKKFKLEYGSEVYYRVQECLERILVGLWGAPGSFRANDILCRRSPSSNIFYIFLERARSGSGMPVPGALERIADRLVAQLQNALWRDLLFDKKKNLVPQDLKSVPDFAVGHSSGIMNPCLDPIDFAEGLMDQAIEASKIHVARMATMRKELLLSVMHAQDLLYPNYQGVFRLDQLKKEHVEESSRESSIRPLLPILYGFESLIRVRSDWVGICLGSSEQPFIEARYFTPDVLFTLAHASDIAVELDQACLRQACLHSARLPGFLFVNIFPRNLYHIDKLDHLLARSKNLIFEVAESEAINNIDLMKRIRGQLRQMNIRVAVDDLGKGYAGIERIIKITPDLIKFDRSLIENIHKDRSKQAFVKGLLEAAKIASTTTLAEGVEKWEEAETLKELGVELIQGFLLHRPQPVDVIMKAVDEAASTETLDLAS